MLATCCIAENQLPCKLSSWKAKQNAPPFANPWVAGLKSVLGVLAVSGVLGACAALSGAAQAAGVRQDAIPGKARGNIAAWRQFHPAQWPYDLPTAAGHRERDRIATRQLPAAVQPGNDQREEPQYCGASCMIEWTVEPEPFRARIVETIGAATPPAPAFRSLPATVPAPAGRAMAPSAMPPVPPAPFLMDRSSRPAGQMWFVVAALLLCGMMFVPGAVVLSFFALSGFVVGGLSLVIDLTWQYQVSIFAILGVALVVLWIWLDPARRRRDDNLDPLVNDRGPGSLVGRVFQLEKPIEGGNGMLAFGGTSWRIAGKDCAAGRRVRVLRAEGSLLIVVPVEC
jgi:membrane protein implicated in regulation of membrane protease activity